MIKIDFKKLISATLIATQLLMPISYVLSISDMMFQTVTKEVEIDNQPPLADITAVEKKKVDIVFTVGDTTDENLLELDQKVEANLSSKVKAAGGDLIDTYIKTIETSEISSTTFGIDEILNSWTTVGGDRWVSSNGELTFNAPGKPLYVMEDGNWQGTLLYDPTALETEDLEIEFNNALQPNLMQGVGWRITKNADGSFNGYFLNIGTHANANGISIMKFTNTRFDEPFTGNSFGFSQSETIPSGLSPTPYSQSIWCWNTGPSHKGRVTYNVGGRRIEHLGVYNTGLQGSIQVRAKGSNFKVYNNGVKIMEVNDSEYSSGTYGFWGNNCEVSGSVRLTDIKIKKDKTLSLDEVLRTYTWRDNSIRFLINLDDTAKSLGNVNGAVDETEYMKIISKLLEEKIYYIGIGDSSVEDISNRVINEINNRGTFYQVDPRIMNFRYTGGPQAVKLSKGEYRLEMWGAAGGGAPANTGMGSSQGAGGYTEGFINIELEHKMQVYVGGKGEYSNAINEGGGWNGGGDGGPGGFGGGGATDIRGGFYSDILYKPISPSLGRFYNEATMHPNVAVTNIAGLDVINIKPGANHEHIMLSNVFKKGFEYVIEFDAYSTVEGDVVHVDAHPDMLPERTFFLTTEKKRYSMDMKSSLPEFGGSALRFFDSGEITKGNIYISNIKVYETKNAQNEYSYENGMAESGTITFGPYVNAHEGVYQVDVYGENMTGATVDVYTSNGVTYPVSSIKWHSPNRFTYYATVTKDINIGTGVMDEDGLGLEFRVHHSGLTNYKFHKQVVTRLQDRILVAGGGGGADNAGGVFNGSDDGSGGHAGGLNSSGAKTDGVIQPGTAATQTSGFTLGRGESVTAVTDTGGAGGGYYGGRVTNHNNGGGGGGSTLYTRVPGSTAAGFQSMPNPMSDNLMIGNTGNGFARITRISGDIETITTALEKSSDYIIGIINSTVIPKSKYILLDSDMKYDNLLGL